MKTLNLIFGVFIFFVSISCEKNFSVDLSDQGYVQLRNQSISLSIGEKYVIKAKTDTLGTQNQTLQWFSSNENVATIESFENHSAIISAKGEGKTIIRVESPSGDLKYFSEVEVKGERVIKILAIGNSFSDDALEHYLYDLANAGNKKILIANMYIGGSSLENHWQNIEQDSAAYHLRVISSNGKKDAFNNVSIQEALSRENWDYISLQQVSQLSGVLQSYQEYLPKLLDFLRPRASNPEVKFVLHQTWAYAADSDHFGFVNYENDQNKMYQSIVDAVWEAKELYDIDLVVPAGTAIQNGRTSYIGDKFTRDGYHLSLGMGRFTASAAWYEAIFGNIEENPFEPESFSSYDVSLAKRAASTAVNSPKEVTELVDFQSPPPNDFDFTRPVFIDFGGVKAGDVFNHFGSPGEMKISNLKDDMGDNTEFSLEISEPFSGTLDRGLENVLGWPKAVSQDMFFSDGIHIARSGFVASNLNKKKKYTFVFYGSINDDKSETQFTVKGKNEGNGVLDNDNNLGKYVIIRDIEPSDNATIEIQLSPGPNNSHFAKFFGVNAMIIVPSDLEIPIQKNDFVLQRPVYIDFGSIDAGPPFYFYANESGTPHFDLKDDQGNSTHFAMSVTDRFTQKNESGELTNTLGLPRELTQDAFYGDKNNLTSGFTISNLNKDQKYKFYFYGSRRGVSDNREAMYLAKGANEKSALLDASGNASNFAEVNGVQPNEDGTIDIVISPGPNNNNGDRFYYINALIIVPENYNLP